MKRISLLLAASFVLTLFATASLAQSGSSSVRGLVTDPQGSPVAGAAVTLANSERNFSRSQTTNTDGNYLFKPVPAGTYRLEVEMKVDRGDGEVSALSYTRLPGGPAEEDICSAKETT